MTLNDLLKRVSKEDYYKVIIVSDGIGWENIEGKIKTNESTITLFLSNGDTRRNGYMD